MTAGADTVWTSEGVLAAERERLVQLCARLTGDADVAEDLAQETLYKEANLCN